ncbi:MAG: hypothetical protein IJD43_15555 [Thermoguttaceae bacterium]|nr:hypothetical protein [Planctomycetaceae bacterium]MBQ4144884.1 hypothetical protein [Thermoguttaceae bacterium]
MNWNEVNAEQEWDESVPPFDLEDDAEEKEPFDFSDVDSMEKEPLVHDAEPAYDVTLAEEASREYVGKWNRLISQTNWEKGEVIFKWRESMIASGVPNQLFSDEAWSRRVGNVTSQHVGRLRRVFERFGDTHDQYAGLFWSHFQAALDWEDAEVWLEGASQNRWSVSAMRKQRWIAIGAPPELKPREEDIVLAELDEDVAAGMDSAALSGMTGSAVFPSPEQAGRVQADGVVSGTARDMGGRGDDFADGLSEDGGSSKKGMGGSEWDLTDTDRSPDAVPPAVEADIMGTSGRGIEDEMRGSVAPQRLFENLPQLPSDLEEAMEMFKLAILNHKLANWNQVTKEDVQLVLAALRQLCE